MVAYASCHTRSPWAPMTIWLYSKTADTYLALKAPPGVEPDNSARWIAYRLAEPAIFPYTLICASTYTWNIYTATRCECVYVICIYVYAYHIYDMYVYMCVYIYICVCVYSVYIYIWVCVCDRGQLIVGRGLWGSRHIGQPWPCDLEGSLPLDSGNQLYVYKELYH